MKTFLLCVLILFGTINSAIAQKTKYTKIKGKTKTHENEFIYLVNITEDRGEIVADSAKITKGKYKLNVERSQLGLYILEVKNEILKSEVPLILILDNDVKKVKIKTDSLLSKSTIKGSEYSKDFSEYMNLTVELEEVLKSNIDEEALYSGDTTVLNKMLALLDSVSLVEFDYAKSYIKNKPESLVSLFMLNSIYKKDNVTGEMFSDLSYINSILDGVSNKYPGSPFISIIKDYKKGLEQMISASNATDLSGSGFEQNVVEEVEPEQSDPFLNKPAPEISLKNPEGEVIKLSSLKGKVVLLDFWASWCGPCRKENPNVVANYEKYKDQGFTIYSVSLDKNKEKWIKAIAQDNLSWIYHVSDLNGWSSAAGATYKINSIPASFLIDENGIIIAKNLRGPALEQKLEEVFKNK